MSDLKQALAAVGESAPERPEYLDLDYADVGSVGRAGAQEERKYALSLESLALRLAVRLERAESQSRRAGFTSCQHRFSANPGMYDTTHRYCEICGVAE